MEIRNYGLNQTKFPLCNYYPFQGDKKVNLKKKVIRSDEMLEIRTTNPDTDQDQDVFGKDLNNTQIKVNGRTY